MKGENIDPKMLSMACDYSKEKEEVISIAKERLANTLLDIPIIKSVGK